MSKPDEVRSVGELVDSIANRLDRDRRILWFRGHRSVHWDVTPSLWRDYDKEAERNFTNRFRSRAATRMQVVPGYDDSAHWLSLMQHYGLPTRLLDWTRSPLIAAYFAVGKYIYDRALKPQDACIWVLEPHLLNTSEKFDDVTPPIDAHMCKRMLTPAFTKKDRENKKVMAVMAAERDLRMFVQQGCFTIHSNRQPLNKREESAEYLARIVIRAEFVRRMAFEIDVSGFRKGDIFPDLDHLAEEFVGIYPPTARKP